MEQVLFVLNGGKISQWNLSRVRLLSAAARRLFRVVGP